MRTYPISASDAPEHVPENLKSLWASQFNATFVQPSLSKLDDDSKGLIAYDYANARIQWQLDQGDGDIDGKHLCTS